MTNETQMVKGYRLAKFYDAENHKIKLTYNQAWNASVLYLCSKFALENRTTWDCNFGERYIIFKKR